MNEIWSPHEGAQSQVLSIDDSVFEILYGGARGGGKTDAGIAWLLKGTADSRYTGLVIRRNHTDLRQWIDRARELYPNAKVSGKPAVFRFPNGAKIYTGHLKDADSYTQYQGHEYQRICLEEAGQIPSEELYLKLISSARSTISIKPQIYLSANPGNVGHGWLKKRFKIGDKKPNIAFRDPISKRYRIYCPATIDDNPTLMKNDPGYVNYLESLPEPLRSAWRYGDWDIFAGQYFKEWDPAYHIKTEEECKKLGFGREGNNTFIGIDWGWAAPYSVLMCQVTPNGRVFVFKELYGKETHPMEVGEKIAKMCQGINVTQSLADPSMWIRNAMSFRKPETQMYSDASIANSMIGDSGQPFVPNMVPANNDRVNGWRNMSELMKVTNKAPNFIIMKGTCPNLARTIPEMICDERRPEDLDTTLEDHAVDACRYMLSHIQAPDERKKKTKDQLRYEELLEPTPTNWNYNFKD